jgi:hypothetical protein
MIKEFQMTNDEFIAVSVSGARLCEPQRYCQPEGWGNELTRLEYSPLLRVADPRSVSGHSSFGIINH